MIIIFGVKHKVFLEREFEKEADPLGSENGIVIAVMQRYLTIAGIPVSGSRKMARAYGIETGQPIPVLMWSESMKRKADEILPQVSGAWKRRLPGQVILLALLLSILYIVVLGSANRSSAKLQEQYRSDPQIGDLVMATESVSYNKTDVKHTHSLIVFKIEDLRGDSLIIRRGMQKESSMEQYRIKNKDKLIGIFDLSDSAFSPETEVYSLQNYREGNERLVRITREYTLREDRERQENILRYTDIIEPIYVKRQKK